MLMALALLAVVDAASPARVELVLTGAAGEPVSAAPRSLSDVARELRDGRRRAVGGFSAIETTVPRNLPAVVPAFVGDEEEVAEVEPEVVPPPGPEYVTTYVPSWVGSAARRGAIRRRFVSPAGAGSGPRPAFRSSAQPAGPWRAAATGRSRRRPG